MNQLLERLSRLSAEDRQSLRRRLQAKAVGNVIAARSEMESIPLSFAQERLWLLHQIEPVGAHYNNPKAFRIHGEFDVEAARRALNEIVRRHEVLRTRFAVENGVAHQEIAPALEIAAPVVD